MSKASKIFFLLNFLFISSIGVLTFNNPIDREKDSSFFVYDKKLEITAPICEEVSVDYKTQKIVVCSDKKLLMFLPLYPEYYYGDLLKIEGKIKQAPVFADFNYRNYLKRKDIYGIISYPKMEKIGEVETLKYKAKILILHIKYKLKRIIRRGLVEPASNLAEAILLGYKESIYDEDEDIFAKAGLSHLIVISGTHMAIFSGILFFLARIIGLSRKSTLRFIAIILTLYVFLLGFSASIVRSFLMTLIMLVAWYYGRLYKSLNALLLSASIMLVFKPDLLFYDIGFQLSYLAVLGIIFIYPLVIRCFYSFKKRKIFLFFQLFSVSLACQLAILPILIINFSQLSLITLISNPFVVWLFPFILVSLFLAITLSIFLPSLTVLFFTPSYLMLMFLYKSAYFFASLPFSVIPLSNVNKGRFLVVYYSVLILVVLFLRRKDKGARIRKGRKTK